LPIGPIRRSRDLTLDAAMHPYSPALSRVDDPALRGELTALADANPEWHPWLALLERTLAALDEPVWHDAELRIAAARPADAPLLAGARLALPAGHAEAWLCALLGAVEPGGEPAPATAGLDAVALLAAGLRQDVAAGAALAREAGAEEGFVAAVANCMALPPLHASARRLASTLPEGWREGYCPLCAGWPALAELRGLERRRVLRCGRCATAWERAVLHCVFCGERDHRRQGALVPDGAEELVRVETCSGCQGYLKALTALRPLPAWALPLEDLRTVELDLVALEKGFRRPPPPPLDLALEIVPAGAAPGQP
jgi:FdhE protein